MDYWKPCKFKVGDEVLCVRDRPVLPNVEKGKVFKVKKVIKGNNEILFSSSLQGARATRNGVGLMTVEDSAGTLSHVFMDRFIPNTPEEVGKYMEELLR